MNTPKDGTPEYKNGDYVRTLITKATQTPNGLEAMHFTQAALNAAQALGQLAFEQREQENHDGRIK